MRNALKIPGPPSIDVAPPTDTSAAKPNRFRAHSSSSNSSAGTTSTSTNSRSAKPWWHARLAPSASLDTNVATTPSFGARIDPSFVSSPFADKHKVTSPENAAWKADPNIGNTGHGSMRVRTDSYDSDTSAASTYRNRVNSFSSLTPSPMGSPLATLHKAVTSASGSRPNPFRTGGNAGVLVRQHSLLCNPYENDNNNAMNIWSPTGSSGGCDGGNNSPSGPAEVLLRGLRMDGPGVGGGGSSCGCGTSIPKQPRRWGAEESQASDNVSGESPGNRHTTAATGDRDDDSDDNKFLISSRSSKRFKSIVTPDSTDQMPNSNDISHNVTGFGLPSCSSMNASQASSQYSPTGTSPTHHITPAVLASLEMPSMRAKPRRFGQIDDEESLIHPFGVSAHRGPRRHMEDRFNIQGRVGGANAKVNVSMYGVFDGHGGASAANFAAEALVNNLAASSSFPEPQSLTQAYLTTDEQFLNTPRQLAGRDPLAGTTALVALVHGDRLITANVGDSRAVIVHANGSATQLTVDHRTHTASEHARIVAAGGTVTGGRVESILSMTRAIGDKRLKQFVIAKPDVKTHKVDESDHFLIIATDGIWDCISNTMAAAIVKCAADASYAANCLLAAASTCSTDNATVLVIDLQKRNKPPPPPQLPRVGAGLERELLHADTAATTINKLKSGGSGSGGDGVRVSTSDAGVMSPQSANVPTIAAVPAVPAVGRSKFRNLASVLRRTLTIEVDDDDDDE